MTTNILEKLAYIMIIIVCFTILCTLFLYISCFLLRQNKKKTKCDHSFKKCSCKNGASLEDGMTCDACNNIDEEKLSHCNTNYQVFKNEEISMKNHNIARQHNFGVNNDLTSSSTIISTINSRSPANNFKCKIEKSPVLDGKIENENNYSGIFSNFFLGMKSIFSSKNNTESLINVINVSDDNKYDQLILHKNDKCLLPLKSTLQTSSDILNSQNHLKKSNMKNSTSNLKHFDISRRNSSIQSAHSVKFKDYINSQDDLAIDTDDDNRNTSDDENNDKSFFYAKLPTKSNLKKSSISSSTTNERSDYGSIISPSSENSSRKNSSQSTTSMYESSVVNYYRKKRLSSDASFNRRKLSVNPFIEPGIKLVTIEQQTNESFHHIPHSRRSSIVDLSQKNTTLSSIQNTQKSKIYSNIANGTSTSPINRRYSVITSTNNNSENLSEKFWVPPDISAKLEKQRSSLPFNSINFSNSLNKVNNISNDAIIKSNDMKLIEKKFSEEGKQINHNSEVMNNQINGKDRNGEDVYALSNEPLNTSQSSIANLSTSLNRHGSFMAHSNSSNSGRRRASMFDPIDPTELQKTLYNAQKNKKSQNSSSLIDNSTPEAIGTVEFAIEYLNDAQKLVVEILRVFDLNVDENDESRNNQSEMYCKCSLMPDKLSFDTNVTKRAQNLIFEQKFEYENLDMQKLDMRYLELTIHEIDKSNENDACLGVVNLKLNHSSIENKNIFIKELRPSLKSDDLKNYIGDLMFSLAYLPAAERLTIVVMKARNLVRIGSDKKIPDSFVKVRILSKDGKKLKKKKTSTQKATQVPVFNEEIVFTNLKKDQLSDINITFTIYHDSITSKEALGYVEINAASKGNEYIQWRDMIVGKKSIAWWHALIPVNNNSSDSDHSNIDGSSTRKSSTSSNKNAKNPTNELSNTKSMTLTKFNIKSLPMLNNR